MQLVGRFIVVEFKMSLSSTVGVARPGSKSLRATIPEGIVAFLEIEDGDRLEWRMVISNEGERSVTVKKVKPINPEALEIAKKYTKEGT